MPTLRTPLTAALAVIAVATAFLAASLSIGPAFAGGPTSALLSVPGEGQTASLYYTDPEYDALADLVGMSGGIGNGTGTVDESGLRHESGPGVTVTWLVHDVTPWRVDRIYLEGKDAPWIATQVMMGDSGTIWDSPVVWHQPEAGAELTALLDRLGVGKVARAAGEFDGVAGAPASASPEPASDEPTAAPAESSALTGVWWGLGGLLGGVVLTMLWIRARAVKAPGAPTVPDDEPAPETAGAGHAVKEELAWPGRRS